MARTKHVTIVVTEREAGVISIALQGLQIDRQDNNANLEAHRIGVLLDKVDDARGAAS